MATKATGQFTIIDYNDAISLSGYIQSNRQKTQMFNPDNASYTPDWSTENLILTPSLFILGNSSDIITSTAVQSVSWYDVTAGSEGSAITANTTYGLSGTKNHVLTVKTNTMAGIPGKEYMCKVVYKDPTTLMDLVVKIPISFSRVVNGSGITDAIAWAPKGNVFKNDESSSLEAECDLWRGSVVDKTSVSYQWYQFDTEQLTDVGGGISWRKLTEVANVTTGVTSSKMLVYPSAVPVYAVFKCIIKDTDSSSNTYNKFFEDTVTFEDKSDPIQVSIVSTGGDVFKNGVGSTNLTAKLFRAGAEIDTGGSGYTYKWFKMDKDGVIDPNFDGTGVNFKTGKSIGIGSGDVNVKATFIVEIS